MKNKKTKKVLFGSLHSPIQIVGLAPIYCFITQKNERVIEIQSFQKALGYDGKSEVWLLNLFVHLSKFTEIAPEILQAFNHPKKVELYNGVNPKNTFQVVNYKRIEQVIQLIIDAKTTGLWTAAQVKYAKNAQKILEQTNRLGLKKTIDQVCGWDDYRNRRKELTEKWLLEKNNLATFLWIKHLPNRFFKSVMALEGQSWSTFEEQPEKTLTWFKKVFYEHLPEELFQKMNHQQPKRIYQKKFYPRKNQLFPELGRYVEQIKFLMEKSENNPYIFEQLLQKTYPMLRTNLPQKNKLQKTSPAPLSCFNQILKKIVT